MCKFYSERTNVSESRGFSLLEIMAVISLTAIISAVAIPQFREFSSNADNAANTFIGHTREIRAKALQETLAFTLEPSGNKKIIAKYSSSCSSTTKTTNQSLTLKLPTGTTLASTSWSLCFDSRGFASAPLTLSFNDGYGGTQSVQVVLGGAARKL